MSAPGRTPVKDHEWLEAALQSARHEVHRMATPRGPVVVRASDAPGLSTTLAVTDLTPTVPGLDAAWLLVLDFAAASDHVMPAATALLDVPRAVENHPDSLRHDGRGVCLPGGDGEPETDLYVAGSIGGPVGLVGELAPNGLIAAAGGLPAGARARCVFAVTWTAREDPERIHPSGVSLTEETVFRAAAAILADAVAPGR